MKYIISVILLLCSVNYTKAKSHFTNIGESIFDSRVGLVDEFIKRFNADRPSTDSIESALPNIVTLFNIGNFSSEDDPLYSMAVEFAGDVIKSGTKLAYSDTLWYAKTNCEGTYNGKKVSFSLKLVVEPIDDNMYKWSIQEAYGDIFNLIPTATGYGFKIMPDDHETNFMSLHEITTLQEDCITNYAAKNTAIDPTTVFFTMVYDGKLKIDHVSSIDFIFNQVPGWSFVVRKFERESTNSGWLIDTLIKQ